MSAADDLDKRRRRIIALEKIAAAVGAENEAYTAMLIARSEYNRTTAEWEARQEETREAYTELRELEGEP